MYVMMLVFQLRGNSYYITPGPASDPGYIFKLNLYERVCANTIGIKCTNTPDGTTNMFQKDTQNQK